ncbi:hypothetical protein [Kordia sp.]|uniref:hypothetical protein n=1 Tax=Kordia sp. TaxID=1965332 RepID=UPI003D6C246D
MKKQKKLKLGKIKIAGINNQNSLFGGVTTHCQTGNDPQEPSCECAGSEVCNTDVMSDCPTTIKTRSESDICGDEGQETRNRATC